MSPPPASAVLAWGLWSVWAAVLLATFWFGGDLPDHGNYIMMLALAGYATVGALVASRRPGNAVGWLLLAAALALSISGVGDRYVASTMHPGRTAVAWVVSWLFNAGLAIVLVLLPLRFPDGRLPSPGWRPVWWFASTATLAWILLPALSPGPLEAATPNVIVNPLGVDGSAQGVLDVVTEVLPYAFAATVLLSVLSLIVRFRSSRGPERQQLKWFLYAAVLPWPGLGLALLGGSLSPARLGLVLENVGWVLLSLSVVLAIPTATGFAMLRYRLYDVDIVINRTLVYGTLTLSLVLLYAALILVAQWLWDSLADNDLVVAGSTLAVAALARPARARVQAEVDRRFFRRKYDARQTLREFSDRLSHEVDLEEVGSELCAVVERSVQPRHISLWLR